jgi:hypothetical protein
MKKAIKWIRDHVRPHVNMGGRKERTEKKHFVDNVKKNGQIGIKFKFKF